MNGLILSTPTNHKDIKYNDKNSQNALNISDNALFEKLVTTLISEEKKSKNGDFLLAKLLNIPTEFEKKGKLLSQFSKDDLKSLLDDTKSNPLTLSDDSIKQDKDELLIGELFAITLALKEGVEPSKIETPVKHLQDKLKDKKVFQSLKKATSLKELLSIAEKNGIKIKNFEFFQEKRALDPKDQKLVQKITSANLFQHVQKEEHKTVHTHKYTTEHRPAKQNILSKLINKSDETLAKASPLKTETFTLSKQHTKKYTPKKLSSESKATIETVSTVDTELQKPDSNSSHKTTHTTKHSHTLQNTKQDQPLKQLFETVNHTEIKPKEDQTIQDNREKPHALERPEHTITHDSPKVEAPSKVKEPVEIKRSLNTFAQEFKEQVDSYKAPLMKVKMQLTPQHLGDVDVTLINRGSTLHVNITSNHNAMAIFMQNQSEFKNSLVNMGFSDLQMNFSQNDQGKNQQEADQKKRQNGSFESFEDEEALDTIDITLPNYI